MVDHNIVGFDVAVHDPHTVAVVQSLRVYLKKIYIYNCNKLKPLGMHAGLQKKPVKHIIVSLPLVVHTCKNVYRNLLAFDTAPKQEGNKRYSI